MIKKKYDKALNNLTQPKKINKNQVVIPIKIFKQIIKNRSRAYLKIIGDKYIYSFDKVSLTRVETLPYNGIKFSHFFSPKMTKFKEDVTISVTKKTVTYTSGEFKQEVENRGVFNMSLERVMNMVDWDTSYSLPKVLVKKLGIFGDAHIKQKNGQFTIWSMMEDEIAILKNETNDFTLNFDPKYLSIGLGISNLYLNENSYQFGFKNDTFKMVAMAKVLSDDNPPKFRGEHVVTMTNIKALKDGLKSGGIYALRDFIDRKDASTRESHIVFRKEESYITPYSNKNIRLDIGTTPSTSFSINYSQFLDFIIKSKAKKITIESIDNGWFSVIDESGFARRLPSFVNHAILVDEGLDV